MEAVQHITEARKLKKKLGYKKNANPVLIGSFDNFNFQNWMQVLKILARCLNFES